MGSAAIRALIADDEPIARQVLREALELFLDVEIAGESADGEETLAKISALRPDVVFLDLQMPRMSGFDVIRKMEGGKLPIIVIVTAYDEHAIRAFEAGAIDYLLKPVGGSRLEKTVERIRELRGHQQEIAERLVRITGATAELPGQTRVRKIVGRIGEEFFLLDVDEVLAFQSEHELVWIITDKQRLLATESMKSLEDRLQGLPFQRVHRNAIVNLNRIRKMSAMSSQRWLLTLDSGLELSVSKRLAHSVREMFS